jgi:hypothetical protein
LYRILEGPFTFDSQTLVSALRIATAYDYPTLRAYAIEHLEKAELSAIERIKIVREFKLASWEEPAYLELCERDEAITMDEASVLGLEAFVHVAGIREREQRRRGKEVDVREQGQGDKLGATEGKEARPAGTNTGHSRPAKNKAKRNRFSSGEAPAGSSTGSKPPLTDQGEEGGTTTHTDDAGTFACIMICL